MNKLLNLRFFCLDLDHLFILIIMDRDHHRHKHSKSKKSLDENRHSRESKHKNGSKKHSGSYKHRNEKRRHRSSSSSSLSCEEKRSRKRHSRKKKYDLADATTNGDISDSAGTSQSLASLLKINKIKDSQDSSKQPTAHCIRTDELKNGQDISEDDTEHSKEDSPKKTIQATNIPFPQSFTGQSSTWYDITIQPLPPPPPPVPLPPPLPFSYLSCIEPPPPPPPPPPVEAIPSTGVLASPKPLSIPAPVPPPKRFRPYVLKPRDLPKISEGWGVGTADKYRIIEQVGEGTYGQVYKASEDNHCQLVALKKVRLENEKEGFPITAVREIKILRQLDHPNIVKLLDIVTGKNAPGSAEQSPAQQSPNIRNDFILKQKQRSYFCNLPSSVASSFYLVFEYVDHDLMGLLDSQLVDPSELQVASLMKQLLLALSYCHMRGFLHRDLKCSNILISKSGQLKLADFGLARLYQENYKRLYTNRVITLWYRPPELLLGEERYGPWVDIWSAGCILAELFIKKPIFQGQTEIHQLEVITSYCGSILPEVWPGVTELSGWATMRPRGHSSRKLREKFSFLPAQALDLLDLLLQLDPTKRPTASHALNHPWLIRVEPELVPPLKLPQDQDCHEMWSKRRRQQVRLSLASSTSQQIERR